MAEFGEVEKQFLNPGVYNYIKDYCKKKHYKCSSCKYGYSHIVTKDNPEYSQSSSCIFANCPCDWE